MDLETAIILDPNPELTPQNPTAPPWIPRLEVSGTVQGVPMSKLKVMADPLLAVDHVTTGDFSAIPLGNTISLGAGQCVVGQGNTNIAGNYQFTGIEAAGFLDYSFISDWQPNTVYAVGNRVRNPIDSKLYRASAAGNFGASFSGAQFQVDVPFHAYTIIVVLCYLEPQGHCQERNESKHPQARLLEEEGYCCSSKDKQHNDH
jgi:hypothetical protein